MMKSVTKKFFVAGLFLILVFSVLFFFLRNSSVLSYAEAACAFSGQKESCFADNVVFNKGLKYFRGQVRGKTSYTDTLNALKDLLWSKDGWNLQFAGAGAPAVREESVLPLRVLARDSSGCFGLVWLAMMVAEKENIALEAILLPGHVTLRYHGIYMEPNRQGFAYTEEEYREKYAVGPWTGLEFRPLLRNEFLGLAAFNIGNSYLSLDVQKALSWYRMAEDLFPAYPGIAINRKIALERREGGL